MPGIINLALDKVLADLEDIGYTGQAFVIPACGVDAPHKRERVAILAYSGEQRWNVRWNRSNQDSESNAAERPDNGRGTEIIPTGERWEDESSVIGMVDGVRTEVYRIDSDSCSKQCEPGCERQMVFTECSSRERERESSYRGNLQELLECTPLGKIGQMNPEWVEWLMGYPIGWTELNV